MPIPDQLVQNIRRLQYMERRWNNREAAAACGLSESRYGEIVSGTAKRIFLDTIDRLCKGFGVERETLLKDVELTAGDPDDK